MDVNTVLAPLSSTAGSLLNVVYLLLLVTPLLVVAWYFKEYNVLVTLRENTGKVPIEHRTRARIHTVDGITVLTVSKKINGRRIECKEPPSEAISVNHKGKKCVTISFVNGVPEYERTEINPENVDETKRKFFDTDAQLMYANQIKKANSRERLTVLKALNDHAGLIAVILIFVLVLGFWENIMQPTVQISKEQAEIAKAQGTTTQQLTVLYNALVEQKQILPPKEKAP